MDKSEKEALVAECRASGITVKEWCEAKGIKYHSYIDWASFFTRDSLHIIYESHCIIFYISLHKKQLDL
ncbi:IS66 family insertion sequence element accessory protein TnpA [Desulfosporosinus nitroreducens]|uniref:IS66 family insertion sequence element accessory protein TnpA n=1 Tax=Desulfosporosinus nitroreducens TaxID=2018668 RepID=UPI00207CF0F3|nr:hypothetical protein [Desulfosporosinus nitroreducens]MCO1603189.1 hypothetical protein [Desulfosporosinus nitroreducens]